MYKVASRDILMELWDKIEKSDCWLWTGAKHKGYGVTFINKKRTLVHKIIYALNNTIPEGMSLFHSCSNRHCCNPAHLIPKSRKGMQINRKLTIEQVLEIRAREGQPIQYLADEFKVSDSTIYLILNNKRWNF